MSRHTLSTLLIAICLPLAGCAICQNPDDDNFGYFGGITSRAHASQGRAGSLFDDGSATTADEGEWIWEDEVVEETAEGEFIDETWLR